ncbi:hypothetical protein D3OALGB2SA_4069 [Olavius algarvensis associated proteobacterium Delta 3]|nr:hypothetical protein D3OALGB2SA_4069 [Olavius algarvensis associated proteobacterium Delta 3]
MESIHHQGAETVNQVKKLTRAGMGLCQGKTCSGLVEAILNDQTPEYRQEAFRSRPPLRSVPMEWLAETADAYPHPGGPTRAVAVLSPDAKK